MKNFVKDTVQQLTLRMPAALAEKLERAARRLRRKRSEVVRLALEMRPIERVRDLLGRVESGLPDLGQYHRDYLLKRLRHGR